VVEFSVNGRAISVEVAAEKPLLWVLREDLRLQGTKFGCGRSLCGACTVHVDGKAVRSCVLPVGSVAGRDVRTIEGLANADGTLHPLQRAFVAEQVPQCGYCQSGQLMSAAALLAENPTPSDVQIRRFMQGNLCRCGTYLRIRRAISRAAAEMTGGAS